MWKQWVRNEPFITVTFQVLSTIATMIGAYGLVYLSIQTKQQAHGQIYQQMVDIDKFFVENPKIRLYIYGCSLPEELFPFASPEEIKVEESRAAATAEMMLDFMSQVALTLPLMGDERVNWETYVKDLYKGSLILQTAYNKYITIYSNEKVSDIIDIAKEEMDKGENPCQKLKTPTP